MTEHSTGAKQADAPQFSLGKVYIKDASVEAPNSPAAFMAESDLKPSISLSYKVEHATLANDAYEVVLTLTVTASDEQTTVFLVEIKQGGIFRIHNAEREQIERFLRIRGPKILFPYARETVDNLVVKAGFPPLMLGPINFQAVQ